MKILVTGGAGFVGKNLCNTLADNGGYQITALDDLSNGSWVDLNTSVTRIESTVSNWLDTPEAEAAVFDIIYHLGEYARVEQSFDEPGKVLESNSIGTAKVLKYCLAKKAKLVYAGSSTKFATNVVGKESSPYALTKAMNTEMIKIFSDWYDLNYAICYFYNVYGPGEKRVGKYATFIGLCEDHYLKKTTLSLTSPGTQERNFTHISDIVNGLILVGKDGSGDNYGIGHPDSYSVLQVSKLFGLPTTLGPEKRGNRLAANVITGKTEKLGWDPQFSLPEYISDFISKNNR